MKYNKYYHKCCIVIVTQVLLWIPAYSDDYHGKYCYHYHQQHGLIQIVCYLNNIRKQSYNQYKEIERNKRGKTEISSRRSKKAKRNLNINYEC